MPVPSFRRLRAALFICAAVAAAPAIAREVQSSTPERQGMSSERLDKVTELADSYVADGKVAGITVVVMRNGRIVHEYATGTFGVDNDTPIGADTILRIYSMSKPIVAVGLMQLYEQGHFNLRDPVSKYIPELADLKVLGPDGELIEAREPPNMQQLLTHSAGFSYGFTTSPIDLKYRESGIFNVKTTDEFVAKVAELPLAFHPGDRWNYSIASDLVGVAIERISGQDRESYLQEHVFGPLDMRDSSFNVAPDKRNRLAQNHYWDKEKDQLAVFTGMPGNSVPAVDTTLYSGGGGLYSTTRDYVRFVEMLRSGGSLDGNRVLSPKTIEYMTINHLLETGATGSGERPDVNLGGFRGLGFGLGFGVVLDTAASGGVGSVGEYSWGGAAGTIFWIDPVEEMAVVAMIQLMGSPWSLRHDLHVLSNAAITELAN